MALPLLHAGTGAGGVPDVGALKWSSGGAFVWSDDNYIVPSLDLNFALFKDLRPRIGPTPSFTRASTGTYFNSSGVLTTAAINGPRFDHAYNGSSWVSKGLLVEEQRTNLCPYSEDLTNASYTKSGITVSADQVAAPDANTTADKIVETAASAYHNIIRFDSGIASGTYTLSAFCKYAGRKYLVVRINDYATDTNAASVVVDLETGDITGAATSYGTFSAASAIVTDASNGWFRIALKAIASSTGVGVKFMLSNNGTRTADGLANSYTGDGTSGAYVWGAQYELGAFATSYIGTTNSSVVRSADVCQITGTDFSGFWNASEGSVVAEFDLLKPTGSQPSYTFLSTQTSIIQQYRNGSNLDLYVYDSGIVQADIVAGVYSSASASKFASCYKSNDFAASLNGAAVVTDTSGSVPVCNKLYLMQGEDLIMSNGHIARLRYFNTRLTNSQLQELST